MLKTENLQEKFYASIAAYYSEIFPVNPAQVAFIGKEMQGIEGKTILDAGCATGELAFQLAGNGANVTAIDLNKSLLARAKADNNHDRITYQWANMLHIARLFGRAKFDGVVCFGNTLVHLLNPMQMRDFFSGVLTVLKPGGVFMLQILNYDLIFKERLPQLPLIETDRISFERTYHYEEGTREVLFRTKLILKAGGDIIENETELLGIGSNDLTLLMDVAGLTEIVLYEDYEANAFSGNKLPLIISSRKRR